MNLSCLSRWTSRNFLVGVLTVVVHSCVNAQEPVRTEIVNPIHKTSFDNDGECETRRKGGNPRTVDGFLVFDGADDGNRQVDPQIAVGGGYVFHGTNHGLIIYDKDGNFEKGVSQNCFNGGIDPKLCFDIHNRVFVFDLWNPWDKEKKKPVNISVSETDDPRAAWNTYPVPAPLGVDGGGTGCSKKWIGYSFPGGPEQTFVLKMEEARAGKPATIYHFAGNLGHPVLTQDDIEDLYFVALSGKRITVHRVTENEAGDAIAERVASTEHQLTYVGYPPQSPQKGTRQLTASGDRNPKNLVLQNGHIWFSHAVNCEGRAAVQWHKMKLDGSLVQTGLIRHETNGYIQTTIAVNSNEDVLIGFQETGPDIYISPRFAIRQAADAPGSIQRIVEIGSGKGSTDGVAWGDYSGTVIDGDNLSDLWTVQSITDVNGKGDTVIARVPFDKRD